MPGTGSVSILESVGVKGLPQRHFKLYGKTPGDGNCFFWAMTNQLEKVGLGEYDHDELQKMIWD